MWFILLLSIKHKHLNAQVSTWMPQLQCMNTDLFLPIVLRLSTSLFILNELLNECCGRVIFWRRRQRCLRHEKLAIGAGPQESPLCLTIGYDYYWQICVGGWMSMCVDAFVCIHINMSCLTVHIWLIKHYPF